MGSREGSDPAAILAPWMALRDLTLDEVRESLAMDASDTEPDSSYGQLEGLTELYNVRRDPARFFFAGQAPQLIYVDDERALAPIDAQRLRSQLGEAAAELSSRAGKVFVHLVYPKTGLAFSAHRNRVAYLEIFRPVSLVDYMDRLYVDPATLSK